MRIRSRAALATPPHTSARAAGATTLQLAAVYVFQMHGVEQQHTVLLHTRIPARPAAAAAAAADEALRSACAPAAHHQRNRKQGLCGPCNNVTL